MHEQQVGLNIPLTRFGPVLSWDQPTIDRLVQKAVELAVQMGICLSDDAEGIYLREAQDKGARVDPKDRTVRFSENQVRETIGVMQKTLPASQASSNQTVPEKGREEKFIVGNGANLLFDWDKWQVKPPALPDFIDLCRWAPGLPGHGSIISARHVERYRPEDFGDLQLRLMSKYCRKVVYHEQPIEPIHVRYLDAMANVYHRHRGFRQPMRNGNTSILRSIWDFDRSPPCWNGWIAGMSGDGRGEHGDQRNDRPGNDRGAGGHRAGGDPGGSDPVQAITAGVWVAGQRMYRFPGPSDRPCRLFRNAYPSGQSGHLGAGRSRVVGADSPCLTWYRDANEPGMQALYEFGMAQAFFSCAIPAVAPGNRRPG